MKNILATATLLAVGAPVGAKPIALKALVDARVRNERVEQVGTPRHAEALTIRLRSGVQASSGAWSALIEGEGTLAVVGRYFDGLHGTATRPLIADPQNVSLYRAQLQYKSKLATITGGRQRIALDDERFVGAVNFRDNGQTFDAVRLEAAPIAGLKADLSYVGRVHTIWGIDGVGARPRSISGNSVLANLSYATPIGSLVGFGYLIDQDEAAVQGYRLSSQSYGARLAGSRKLSKHAAVSYQFSYARQSNYNRNPNRYRADYYLVDATLDAAALKLNGGYEVLGADRGTALTSFQTPLATGFKFQGWADKFLTTPPNGVRDAYAGAGYGWKKIGRFDALSVQAVYHDFRSDRLSQHYGTELDLLATAKIHRTTLSARYADYRARTFATSTRKFWLQADWVF